MQDSFTESNETNNRMGITRIHVQDNIVTQDQHTLASWQFQASWGPSTEGELVGHAHDLYCSYISKWWYINDYPEKRRTAWYTNQFELLILLKVDNLYKRTLMYFSNQISRRLRSSVYYSLYKRKKKKVGVFAHWNIHYKKSIND